MSLSPPRLMLLFLLLKFISLDFPKLDYTKIIYTNIKKLINKGNIYY
ncbi:MAG: hypothetical protein NV1_11 [Nanoarchaeotal virus 1]|nr:MAG: hypothetical protein NV1_11 [Nanoarchaeotal virus 1]